MWKRLSKLRRLYKQMWILSKCNRNIRDNVLHIMQFFTRNKNEWTLVPREIPTSSSFNIQRHLEQFHAARKTLTQVATEAVSEVWRQIIQQNHFGYFQSFYRSKTKHQVSGTTSVTHGYDQVLDFGCRFITVIVLVCLKSPKYIQDAA